MTIEQRPEDPVEVGVTELVWLYGKYPTGRRYVTVHRTDSRVSCGTVTKLRRDNEFHETTAVEMSEKFRGIELHPCKSCLWPASTTRTILNLDTRARLTD